MTQNEKDLLLKDICARLPYGVKVQSYSYEDDIETVETLYNIDSDGYMSTLECDTLKNITKPYLFPISKVVEEIVTTSNKHIAVNVDFSHKNHIDYRGLIPKGLAIDATGLNIY